MFTTNLFQLLTNCQQLTFVIIVANQQSLSYHSHKK